MPIYEYECTNCHHKYDVLQKINDEPIKKCPECAKDTVVRLVSAVGFQLKGTGWYATDFKNKGKPEQKTDRETSDNNATKDHHSTKDNNATKDNSATNSATSSDSKNAEKKTTEPSTASSVTSKGESD